jgi:hypothetical protein
MNHDFTFVRPLGVAPSIFHTPPFPFYLDEEIMDKEVTAWPGVTKEQKRSGVISYVIPDITMVGSGTDQGAGPSMTTSKREWNTPSVR